ncbi:hypothetical protein [Planktotalea arctica]|uniref:hypothetical protein n=1 Tax=Planktotalea arctica TaxID=1481893 RepID=UPI00111C4BAC|nr:hypothetical protein [Planktotalea arctica]
MAFLLTMIAALRQYSVQGRAMLPNYQDHPFHSANVDFKSDGKDVGFKIISNLDNVDSLTRLGYAFALAKFPDAQSCLSEPSVPLGIESRLNLRAIKRHRQAAVCFFNIAYEFKSREKVAAWLLSRLVDITPDAHRTYNVETRLGTSDTKYLTLTLPELRQQHCLLNLYQCVFGLRQAVYMDISAEGKIVLLKVFKPRVSLN